MVDIFYLSDRLDILLQIKCCMREPIVVFLQFLVRKLKSNADEDISILLVTNGNYFLTTRFLII